VLFVVAGPWSHVAEEYDQHQDLLWLDMDEIYLTEISHLTFKTMAFLTVLYERAMATSEFLQYLFKTDDDSYVAIKKLHHVLFTQDRGAAGPDYWGKCRTGAKPHRNQVVPWQKKWFIPYEVYPEAEYPPYCQGAGYAVSKKFLACAIGERHAAVARYQPNEDVAVGMLAERCHIKCTSDDRVWIRYDAARDGRTMDRRVVQHYVQSEEEMRAFHDSVTVALY
jgi:beta-1,3-galactosyltransferase 1